MQNIRYYEVNPGGNTTAIIRGVFTRSKRKVIALKILQTNPRVEQVGFWMPAKSNKCIARLEMAGGEFCGNAVRSLAALIGKKGTFQLEVSGLPWLVEVNASKSFAAVSLPLKSFRLKDSVCTLPGITHVLSPNDRPTLRSSRSRLRRMSLLSKKASGVIGYRENHADLFEIFPVVWVRDIATLFAETACASGTAALAYSCWWNEGRTRLRVKQPSGSTLKTEIKSDFLTISGPILGVSCRTLEVA